jgi:RNA-directed DNA polymerase
LEFAAKNSSRSKTKLHLTPYADNFVCTGNSQIVLGERIKPAIADFVFDRGLQYKDSKTRIVNIEDGFDLLGFTIQHKPFNYKLNPNKKAQLPNGIN